MSSNGAPAAYSLDRPFSHAVLASGVRKQYRLGELETLKRRLGRVIGRSREAGPQTLEALGGVDFAVAQGEALGIVGRNGSGKSTLLQILAGTTLPTSGLIKVRGRVLPLLAVGQGFHPELTAAENVMLFASSLGIPRRTIEARMEDVAEFAELDPAHMTTPVKRFSSGMTSRLSFATAVQFPSDIYIFDEVLAVIDGEFQARCLTEIRRLHAEGRTILFVSHHRNQMEAVCERIIWLEKGVVRETGPTIEVLDAYEHIHGADGP